LLGGLTKVNVLWVIIFKFAALSKAVTKKLMLIPVSHAIPGVSSQSRRDYSGTESDG